MVPYRRDAELGDVFDRTKVKRPFYVGSGPFWNGVDGGWGAWTDYTALKLNVTRSEITGGNNAPRGCYSGFNENDDAEIWGVGLRAQVDW